MIRAERLDSFRDPVIDQDLEIGLMIKTWPGLRVHLLDVVTKGPDQVLDPLLVQARDDGDLPEHVHHAVTEEERLESSLQCIVFERKM